MQGIPFKKVGKIDESAQFRLELNSHEKNCERISIYIRAPWPILFQIADLLLEPEPY